MPKTLHPIAGGLALLLVVGFWLATAISELAGPESAVIAVKTAIPWGLLVLVPALAMAGGSGFRLARTTPGGLAARKGRRMPIIAASGLLILVPAALFLAAKARAGEIDSVFYAVQAVELLAGAVNITLLALNLRDGLRMSGRLPGPAA
ncbi:hypothetical protein [Roseospirillum parvum]|uniref:Transmembrane protein n=1 Tax=Roseospirillum parvum TaxID=83401 RepID=A0A1G8APM3_9PROT|nr:hypothetical protein [Roseospirillum parvum]SDH22961.1 hypothetical protein SAMN05421742_10566 [Roseospirillum parvum]